ncbi:hypothetical protein ES332_D12G060300v1 [Gossypium tomentosum]|uniref:Uncharacterized protein n=1 Tax=Gossypium tomentosum TaxID=34277 RepID=A0A5D2I772_GOSTO|nr:hypothetical protein ES332_D12G060300v1 [Gossypium tomentosum]
MTVPAFDDSRFQKNLLVFCYPFPTKAYFPFFSLVALANFSPVRGEHNLEHHPIDNGLLPFLAPLSQEYRCMYSLF